MKKLIVLIMLILTLGVLSVSAADVAVTNSFSVSSPTFGSANQRASNPNHDTSSSREVFTDANGALPITNNGAVSHTITGVKFISSSRGFISTDLNFSLVGGSKIIAAGASDTITLNARIPQGLDAVDSNLQGTGFDVAVVAFVNASGTEVSDQFTVFMRRENNLELDDIDVTIISPGGGRDTNSVSDTDDDIEGVKPGDDIEVKIEVENLFSNNEDVDIEDVDVGVSIDTSDFDEDDDDNIGDVSADDKNSASMRFEVDEDAEDDTGDIVFEAEGEDEFGALHGERLTVEGQSRCIGQKS
ncbi:hypothetical protein HYT58_01730 [Candidatus Woesearchaeota archaeon]|nr:hypothetical protein [Candidatus Woesearchaeota archaeon]